MPKRLDEKISRIRSGMATARDFIIADAKDADMAFGVAAPGADRRSGRWKTLADYREQIRAVIKQDVVDVVLLSASNLEQLAMNEHLFADSAVTRRPGPTTRPTSGRCAAAAITDGPRVRFGRRRSITSNTDGPAEVTHRR